MSFFIFNFNLKDRENILILCINYFLFDVISLNGKINKICIKKYNIIMFIEKHHKEFAEPSFI